MRTCPSRGSLADLVRFNEEHAEQELVHFGQERFEQALESGPLDGEDVFAGAGYGTAAGRKGGAGRGVGRVSVWTR